MRYGILAGVVSLGMLVTAAQAQEGSRNDVTVSALGSFQQNTSGNGVNQTANSNAGVLFSYRYFFTDHQGIEANYGFTRYDQQFTGSSLAQTVTANTSEANLSYVFRFGIGHGLTPFFSAGTGALVFAPQHAFNLNGIGSSTFDTPDFVYSAGADLALSKRVSLRLGYRGHVFQAPDFGVSTLHTGSIAHMAEPFGGLSFHF